MRTIGKRRQYNRNAGIPWHCDICGVKWPAAQLVRNADGLLVCPEDRERSRSELGRINADSARDYAARLNDPVRRP